MTKDYHSEEFPLVEVILPKQELKPDGATIFKVIDGFIEKKLILKRCQECKKSSV